MSTCIDIQVFVSLVLDPETRVLGLWSEMSVYLKKILGVTMLDEYICKAICEIVVYKDWRTV